MNRFERFMRNLTQRPLKIETQKRKIKRLKIVDLGQFKSNKEQQEKEI